MSGIIELNDHELACVVGGGNFFEDLAHGKVSRAFGREGKPFIGRDFTRVIAEAAPVVAAVCPPAAPIALNIGGLAGISSALENLARDGDVPKPHARLFM